MGGTTTFAHTSKTFELLSEESDIRFNFSFDKRHLKAIIGILVFVSREDLLYILLTDPISSLYDLVFCPRHQQICQLLLLIPNFFRKHLIRQFTLGNFTVAEKFFP